jgi:hypothetical protein
MILTRLLTAGFTIHYCRDRSVCLTSDLFLNPSKVGNIVVHLYAIIPIIVQNICQILIELG